MKLNLVKENFVSINFKARGYSNLSKPNFLTAVTKFLDFLNHLLNSFLALFGKVLASEKFLRHLKVKIHMVVTVRPKILNLKSIIIELFAKTVLAGNSNSSISWIILAVLERDTRVWTDVVQTGSDGHQGMSIIIISFYAAAAPCFKAVYSLTLHGGVAFYYHLLGDWHKMIIALLQIIVWGPLEDTLLFERLTNFAKQSYLHTTF